jgi:PAP2 superfamily C-terminal
MDPKWPNVLAVLFLIGFLVFLLHLQLLMVRPYLHAHGKKINGSMVLPDLLHTAFPNVPHPTLRRLTESIYNGVFLFFLAFFLWYDYRVILFFFVVYFGTSLFLTFYHIATVLPDSKNGKCIYAVSLSETAEHRGSCNCLNVSGHLIFFGLMLYLFSRVHSHRYAWAYLTLFSVMFLLICLSRNHYTVDCITSVLILALLTTYATTIDNGIYAMTNIHLLRDK